MLLYINVFNIKNKNYKKIVKEREKITIYNWNFTQKIFVLNLVKKEHAAPELCTCIYADNLFLACIIHIVPYLKVKISTRISNKNSILTVNFKMIIELFICPQELNNYVEKINFISPAYTERIKLREYSSKIRSILTLNNVPTHFPLFSDKKASDNNAMQLHTSASNRTQIYFYANSFCLSLASRSGFILQRALEDETGA